MNLIYQGQAIACSSIKVRILADCSEFISVHDTAIIDSVSYKVVGWELDEHDLRYGWIELKPLLID